MKNIIFLFIIFIISACSNSFLELYPETSLSEGTFYNTEEEMILLANGCYVPMRNYEKATHWFLSEMISDNTSYQFEPRCGSGTTGREAIDMFLSASNYSLYSDFWDFSYKGITCCNKLLNEIDNDGIKWSDVSYKNRCSGEAIFLRALYYFNLVRQFGGVPLVIEPVSSQAAVDIKRSTEDEIYTQIISDLTQSVTYFTNSQDVEEDGRANLGAANALLGKVYLTRYMFDEAATVLIKVIDSKKYELLQNYSDLFDPSNKDYKETIFAMQYSEVSDELSNNFIFWFAPNTSGGEITQRPTISLMGHSGYNQPTEDLINAFESGDQRKAVSIGFWTGLDSDGEVKAIPYCSKYKPPISAPDNRCSDNFPILRYSDVLLMYAEVLNEKGYSAEAIPYIMKVRERAGLTNDLVGADQESIRTIIAHERQVEFCFENQRWYDLKRTGKALEVMAAHGVREKNLKSYLYPDSFQMDEYMLLAPIPSEEVLINKIIQNPGY